MSLTLIAQLAAETDLLAAVGADASLAFDAWLEPDALARLDVAGPNVVVTLGPYIEVVTTGGGGPAGVASSTINGHRFVAWQSDGTLAHAQPGDLFAIAGLTTSAATVGQPVAALSEGAVAFSGWSWAPGPVFLGVDGTLTQTLPASGWVVVVGRGDGTRLFITIQPPVAVQ